MTRQWLATFVLLLTAAGAAAGCTSPHTTVVGSIERIDARAVLEPDGDLVVTETLEIAPDSGGRVGLERYLDSTFADGATLTRMTLDGAEIDLADASLAVSPTSEGGVRAAWQPDAGRTTTAIIEFEYTLRRAAAVTQPRGRLEWPVLEPARAPGIGAMHLSLELPGDARFYEGTGVGQAGWTVTVDGRRMEATRAPLAAGEGATLLAVFDVDRSRVRQGEWEWNRERRGQYVYALVAAGLFIVVVGLGVLIVLRLQYPPLRSAPESSRGALAADRATVSQGLRTTALVSLPFAAVMAAAGARWLGGLGPAIYAIPGSIALVALLLLVASWTYARR